MCSVCAVKKNKALPKSEPTATRVTLPLGVKSHALFQKIAARYRKESGGEWSLAEVVLATAGIGLRMQCQKFKHDHPELIALKD